MQNRGGEKAQRMTSLTRGLLADPVGAGVAPVTRATDSASSHHKRAAADHELAARQHRKAAESDDKRKWHAAMLASASAMECAEKAHQQSISACKRSAQERRFRNA